MKYQLILQFEATSIEDFDGLIVLEEILITTLPRKCQVDGHDFGMGEFNIFILTDDPESAFARFFRTTGGLANTKPRFVN